MRHTLYVRYEEATVGTIEVDGEGRWSFRYDRSWLAMPDAFPVCIALKLQESPHDGKIVEAFFENLLPEGSQRRLLESLAGLPEGDDMAFLKRFGEDCAGALTISAHSDEITVTNDERRPEIAVDFEAIEQAIEEGLPIQSALDHDGELPPFSLAGAQAKFPCVLRDSTLFIPRNGVPTTHIVKLPVRAGNKLLDSVQNEFLCMSLAIKVGLNVPKVMLIGKNIPLFCIERFDRARIYGQENRTRRLHTQDFCQALGKLSREKYERHSGPSFADCYRLLDVSSEIASDRIAILEWLAFNLAIGNNDSHAKNLSLLLSNGDIRLAPFYDLICTAIYKQYSSHFAFKIGETNSWQRIRPSTVEAFARSLGITPAFVRSRWLGIFDKIEAALASLPEVFDQNKDLAKTKMKLNKEVSGRLAQLKKQVGKKKSTA